MGRGWHSCPVEQGGAPHTGVQATPFLQVCHAGQGVWHPVIVSLEHLPEIQPSAGRKDPSLQLWSPELAGLHGHQPFSSLMLPMESPASCCLGWLKHLGVGNGKVLLCGAVNHRGKEKKSENTFSHTKPTQKKDAFLISFMSASNSTHDRVKATQGRENQAP